MGRRVFYVTREEVMDAFDVKEAANRFAQVDDAIASASDSVDGWLNRHKHGCAPTLATRYFDWPGMDYARSYRLWFMENELISATSITAGGRTLTVDTDIFLEPVNSGPPYTYAEINLAGQSSFDNTGTRQRAVTITGLWGIGDEARAVGDAFSAMSTSSSFVDVTDSSLFGVGDVLRIDDERMAITERSPLVTSQTLDAPLDDVDADRILHVAAGSALHEGEILLLEEERVKVINIMGNEVVVDRAVGGSTLAVHEAGTVVWALRRLRVDRGVLGTTVASHSAGAPITRWVVPELIRDLAKAEAITRLEQEWSAYGARVYSDEAERDSSGTEVVSGRGLTDVRRQAARRYRRKFRKWAV